MIVLVLFICFFQKSCRKKYWKSGTLSFSLPLPAQNTWHEKKVSPWFLLLTWLRSMSHGSLIVSIQPNLQNLLYFFFLNIIEVYHWRFLWQNIMNMFGLLITSLDVSTTLTRKCWLIFCTQFCQNTTFPRLLKCIKNLFF